jgi:hypothetical protein
MQKKSLLNGSYFTISFSHLILQFNTWLIRYVVVNVTVSYNHQHYLTILSILRVMNLSLLTMNATKFSPRYLVSI